RTSSWTSRNCRSTRPTDRASSGSRSGPTTISATARTTRSSRGPTLSIELGTCPTGSLSAAVATGGRLGGRPSREAGCPVGGSRRLGSQLLGDGLELLLHPAGRAPEQDHMADEETEHHQQRGGRDEPDDQPHH